MSFGLVALAAVALYRPDAPHPTAALPAANGPIETAEPTDGPADPGPSRSGLAGRPRPDPEAATSDAVDGRSLARATIRRPGSAFTTAQEGETLADVAWRVYGHEAALRPLWRANHDQLERPDSPLMPGSVLRTPDLWPIAAGPSVED